MSGGRSLAIAAGFCGAMAATCAKLAMAAESAEEMCHMVLLSLISDQYIYICSAVLVYLRLACFGLIFLFNGLMWTLFVKSLQRCSTSLEATVTNTGANIALTAIIGWLLFDETLSLRWWCGASLIVIGLVLVHHGSPQIDEETATDNKSHGDTSTDNKSHGDTSTDNKPRRDTATDNKPRRATEATPHQKHD